MRILLFFTLTLLFTTNTLHAQYIEVDKSTNSCVTCEGVDPACSTTHVESEKTVSYTQYIVQEFNNTNFIKKYIVQYAIVSDIFSMPENSMALSFYTDDGPMYMIVSADQYNTHQAAELAGARAKAANNAFCNYIVKVCYYPKNASTATNASAAKASPYLTANYAYTKKQATSSNKQVVRSTRTANLEKNYRIQYTWTKNYPFETLTNFTVEEHNGGYKQVSTQAFANKQAAQNWLTSKGYQLADFWIYSL